MPGELARQQARLQAAILDPARAAGVETMLTALPSLASADCLAIYQRAYRARRLECMRAYHPVLCRLLGRELFDAFALDYLAAQPSRDRTLDDLGTGFAAYLKATRPGGAEHADWCDLIIDIARFERAFVDTVTAVGVEDTGGVDAERLPPPSHPGWPDATVTPAPCLRLLALDFPVHTYITAVHSGDHAHPLPTRARTRLALSRRDYVVTAIELEAAPWWLLAALVTGNGPRAAGLAARMTAPEVAEWLRHWAALGLLVGITVPNLIGAGGGMG